MTTGRGTCSGLTPVREGTSTSTSPTMRRDPYDALEFLSAESTELTALQVPQFVPAMGSTGFWHNKTRFRLYRKKESLVNIGGYQAMKDQEEITIACYGRSIGKICFPWHSSDVASNDACSPDQATARGGQDVVLS